MLGKGSFPLLAYQYCLLGDYAGAKVVPNGNVREALTWYSILKFNNSCPVDQIATF